MVEERAAKPRAGESDDDPKRLVQELEIHQIELEMQNEELRAARMELEAGLERYTELFDFAPIGYATLVPDVIREINHAGARLLGTERSRLIERRFAAFVAQHDVPAFTALLGKALEGDGPASGEFALVLARGTSIAVRLTVTTVSRPQPTFLLAFEDITARRAAEDALREADRRKSDFLAVLSHELRNPLMPIWNGLYLLDHVEPGSEPARRARAIIERQITHLTRMVEDLLDIARIDRGKIQLQLERIELEPLVSRTIDDHRASYEASGIVVGVDFQAGSSWVDADSTRVNQIISNVLGNAEKFTPRGGSVEVSIRRRPPVVTVRVRDSGAGIPAELIDKVFEPFAQAPQTMARSRGGLGLGLAMVKHLVELHGGRVSITSEGIGRGSEIAIVLPLAEAPVDVAPAAVRPAQPRRRILVIEDLADAAASLEHALTLSGHEVRIAMDGLTGLALARTFRPEILICDIGLPGMTGYQVAAAFRSDAQLTTTYLMALSGYADPEDIRRATDAGFDRYLAKPIDMATLGSVLAGISR
ncbi:MAG TPA: ATP-binding protein [Kofleriaceae bacterium]|nr:ATP-binding protein [Kofleriaceae bacterium]